MADTSRETFTSAVYDEVRQRSYNSDCYRPYLVDNDEWLLVSRHVSICRDRHLEASPRQEVILIFQTVPNYSSLLLLFISNSFILLTEKKIREKRNEKQLKMCFSTIENGSSLRHPALTQVEYKKNDELIEAWAEADARRT